MNKKIALIALYLFILFLSLAYINLNHYINFQGSNSEAVTVIIKRGYSVKRIGKELAKHNIISSPKFFYLVHRVFFKSATLQAGEYEIPPHASLRNIIDIMHKGIVIIHKLTLPEGITHQEIIDKIRDNDLLVGDITNEYHEGDFLADTYYYIYGESRMTLINRMYHKSQLTIDSLWSKRQENLPLTNKTEAITLASIIEKETSIASERSRIAGVFTNRLRKKMKLQADPTVIYAVTMGKVPFTRSITKADLKIDSPYNTYLYQGLPPTAIGAPGKEALEAVLNPMNTKELYFVVNGKGGHNFSSSLAEHNNYVKEYRNAK